jgi:hypothetical protein
MLEAVKRAVDAGERPVVVGATHAAAAILQRRFREMGGDASRVFWTSASSISGCEALEGLSASIAFRDHYDVESSERALARDRDKWRRVAGYLTRDDMSGDRLREAIALADERRHRPPEPATERSAETQLLLDSCPYDCRTCPVGDGGKTPWRGLGSSAALDDACLEHMRRPQGPRGRRARQ